jgi:rhodanese-related sulfurtransferase
LKKYLSIQRIILNRKPTLLAVVLLILILAACSAPSPAAAPVSTQSVAAGVHEISVAEAAASRDAGAFVLDVRQPEEWQEIHVPGATLIPLAELESRLNEVPKDKEIVVMCRSGNRSKTGAEILMKAGYQDVSSMAGGITDWSAKGYPTTTGP